MLNNVTDHDFQDAFKKMAEVLVMMATRPKASF
jgi:hypothetical protein